MNPDDANGHIYGAFGTFGRGDVNNPCVYFSSNVMLQTNCNSLVFY